MSRFRFGVATSLDGYIAPQGGGAAHQIKLQLVGHEVYQSGIVTLMYDVQHPA